MPVISTLDKVTNCLYSALPPHQEYGPLLLRRSTYHFTLRHGNELDVARIWRRRDLESRCRARTQHTHRGRELHVVVGNWTNRHAESSGVLSEFDDDEVEWLLMKGKRTVQLNL